MSHLPWSSKSQKQDIAERFFQGDLAPTNDHFIPYNHCSSLCLLPMAMFFVSPLSVMAVSIGIIFIRDPRDFVWAIYQMYEASIAMGWQGPMVTIVLLLLTAIPTIWMGNQGVSAFRFVVLGVRERQRERKTGQYRYGLLLTKDYLALRTLDPLYNQEPLILSRPEISQFRMEYSRSSGGGGAALKSSYIMMDLHQPDGTIRAKPLPTKDLKEDQRELYSKLKRWL